MGTRALIKINMKKSDEMCPIVCIYKQHDGYPSGLGITLQEFLSRKTIINGISGSPDPANYSNGAYDLVAQLVCELKNIFGLGSVYLYPTDTKDVGQDYTYTVNFSKEGTGFDSIDVLNSVSVRSYGDETFFGGENVLSDFLNYINQDDE